MWVDLYSKMSFFKTKKGAQALVLALVFFLVFGTFFFRQNTVSTPILKTDKDPTKIIAYWSNRIDAVGAESAYQQFSSFYKESDYTVQHPAAHIMGALLYQKLGNKGLSVCDSLFAFGCYHQFFASALADAGPEVVQKLDEVCIEKFGRFGTGCQHGIGHGLVEYFGYEKESLLQELSLCSLTTVVGDYFGCSSGVFMQYNIPVSFSGGEIKTGVRPFDSKNPITPCDTFIPETNKKPCYFSLGQWWFAASSESFEKLGTFCAFVDGRYRESCYLGLGNSLIHEEKYDYRRGLSACRLMPDWNAELLCRAGASWGMFAEPLFRVNAWRFCEGLSVTDQEFCRNKSDLIGNQEIFGEVSPV